MADFDPELDDTTWTDAWHRVPIAQVAAGEYAGGYRVERRVLHEAEVFGRAYRLASALECTFLYDPQGWLWMSNTPQERIMMHNNGRHTWGRVLVGGLGLGLYPQYAQIGAAGEATSFVVIERSPAVRSIVEPMLRDALRVQLMVETGEIEDVLSGPASTQYDTIFLDTWETLDAGRLPEINRLRELARRHLSPPGRVLLWGYRWMVRLFEDACRQLLEVAEHERDAWLARQAGVSPQAVALLGPVVAHFGAQPIEDAEAALAWCRDYVTRVAA